MTFDFFAAPTTIDVAPESQAVNVTAEVVFRCKASTDVNEVSNLVIKWLRNEQPINYEQEGRISMNTKDNSLHISNAQVRDSTKYTCVATNGIDSDSVTVELLVRGKTQ